jgi:hypothetical protein
VLCSRVVKRGGEVVKASPEGCIYAHPRYTEAVELPAVRVLAEGADWRAEALEGGEGEAMFYIQYKKIFTELDSCFSAARGCKLLLYGPPGTGKSYAPKYFGRKWGVKLNIYSPGSLLSKYLGETEENISRALDAARRGEAVLLDEFEVFAMTRERVSELKLATVQVLLTELQELDNGVVVATTNADPSLIDPALRRGGRLKPIAVPLPTREMLEFYARYKGIALDAAVQSFAEVGDPRDVYGTEWYYLLPPLQPPRLDYTIDAERGIYRASWGAVQEIALSLLWFYFSGRRQVWWLRKPRADYTYVIDMADSYGAVVFVDDMIAEDVAKFLRPLRSALFVFHATVPGVHMPPLPATIHTYAASLESFATRVAAAVWSQLKPKCRSMDDADTIVRAVWSSC